MDIFKVLFSFLYDFVSDFIFEKHKGVSTRDTLFNNYLKMKFTIQIFDYYFS
jgi:hypothetical protein